MLEDWGLGHWRTGMLEVWGPGYQEVGGVGCQDSEVVEDWGVGIPEE